MKTTFRISALVICLIGISYGVMKFIEHRQLLESKRYSERLFSNKTKLKPGFASFHKQMAKEVKDFSTKKYYYINIWERRCKPCIEEMPYLDTLVSRLRNDVQCFFVTEEDNALVMQFLEKKELYLKHFTIKNDLRDFCAGIFNETLHGRRVYPLHVIMDSTGRILHFRTGAMIPHDIFLMAQFKKLKLLE